MQYQITFKCEGKDTLKQAFSKNSLYHILDIDQDLQVGSTFPWTHRGKQHAMVVLERQETDISPFLLVEETIQPKGVTNGSKGM